MEQFRVTIPHENLEIFQLLYALEVGLREFIIATCTIRYGARWWSKSHIPNDVITNAQDRLSGERKARWSQLVPHHPIYFSDFPDLKKIITKADNWRDVFEPYFKRREIIDAVLSGLEPIRNKIGHNRKSTQSDLKIVAGTLEMISTAIGPIEFSAFVANCTFAKDMHETLRELHVEARQCYDACQQYNSIRSLTTWLRVQNQWWYDSNFLGEEIAPITDLFNRMMTYSTLSRNRGQGHVIEAWVKAQEINALFNSADEVFINLLTNP